MPRIVTQTSKKEDFSFMKMTKQRFVAEFNRIKEKYELNNIVLVLDLQSARIISAIFTITELVQHGIVFIERLQVVRKQLDHHAIYFITPSEKSIQLMLNDYKSQSELQYRKVHVLFTASLDKAQMQKIGKNPFFMKKLARHSFKEFYCEVAALSDNSIHLSINYLALAFSKESMAEQQARDIICKRFVHLVTCYESLNVIRIYYQASVNKVAQRVAEKAAEQLKRYLYRLVQNKSVAIREDAADVTIFITDRSIDVITPIIHGYAYESLLYDIINLSNQSEGIDPNKLKGDLFDQFRYRHLSHALTQLPQRLQTLANRINNEKIQAIEIKKLKDQKQALEYHLEILRRLWERFKEKNIGEVGQIELCLATGIMEDGKQTSSSQLFEKIITLIKNNAQLTANEMMRLAMLTIICIKLSKEDYQSLLGLFKEEEKRALKNLAVFGMKYDKKISKSTKAIDKSTMERAKTKLQTVNMPSERFTCALEIILPRLIDFLKIERNRSEKRFMEEIMISALSKEGAATKFDEKKLICFMCGGLSQTQICSIRKNSALSNIVLASDSILTPTQFVESLGKINLIDKTI